MTSSLNLFIFLQQNYVSNTAYVLYAVQILERVSDDTRSTDTSSATSDANVSKNRYQDKIPCKKKSNSRNEVAIVKFSCLQIQITTFVCAWGDLLLRALTTSMPAL